MVHSKLLPLTVVAVMLLLGLRLAAASDDDTEVPSHKSIRRPRSLRPAIDMDSMYGPDDDSMESMDLSDDEMEMVNKAGTMEDVASSLGVSMSTMNMMGMSQADSCHEPQTECVDLDVGDNFWPHCKLLRRCAKGCGCVGRLTACLPTETSQENITVTRMSDMIGRLKDMRSSGASTRTRRPSRIGRPMRPGAGRPTESMASERRTRRGHEMRTKTITVEQHDKCSCQCKVQEKDCNLDLHEYRMRDCACVCKNKQDKVKCSHMGSKHYWNSNSCSCLCINKMTADNCGNGQMFDQASCSCIQDPGKGHVPYSYYL